VKIRDRIKELRRVKASELHPNPKNWRTHPKQQLDALRGILAEVGFAGAELARELPDGSLQLIDGHARAEIAGDAEIPVLVLDVTESEADKILATFDPLGAMAEADAGKLEELLREVQTGSEALAEMLSELAEDNGIVPGEDAQSKAEKPELEISPELHERQDYLVIVFDNELDWQVACERFQVQTKRSSQVETSTIEKTGIGRVITSQHFLKVINEGYSHSH
jgi:hypothetical protein